MVEVMFGGKIMDTFMDKLASRFNAQEMIRANAAAEAKENERLQKEVEVYKQCLQEMREISLQNASNADEVARLVQASMDKIAVIQAESGKSDDVLLAMKNQSDAMLEAVRMNSDKLMSFTEGSSNKIVRTVESNSEKIVSEIKSELQSGNDEFRDALKEALKAEILAEIKKEFKLQEENVHKECVKVYRNVQAVVTEETEKQTDAIVAAQSKGSKKASAALVCGILAMSFAGLGLIVSVLDVFGVFAMLF